MSLFCGIFVIVLCMSSGLFQVFVPQELSSFVATLAGGAFLICDCKVTTKIRAAQALGEKKSIFIVIWVLIR